MKPPQPKDPKHPKDPKEKPTKKKSEKKERDIVYTGSRWSPLVLLILVSLASFLFYFFGQP